METPVELVVAWDVYVARIERVKKAAELRLPLSVQKAAAELLVRSFSGPLCSDDHHEQIVLSYERGKLPY